MDAWLSVKNLREKDLLILGSTYKYILIWGDINNFNKL